MTLAFTDYRSTPMPERPGYVYVTAWCEGVGMEAYAIVPKTNAVETAARRYAALEPPSWHK